MGIPKYLIFNEGSSYGVIETKTRKVIESGLERNEAIKLMVKLNTKNNS